MKTQLAQLAKEKTTTCYDYNVLVSISYTCTIQGPDGMMNQKKEEEEAEEGEGKVMTLST